MRSARRLLFEQWVDQQLGSLAPGSRLPSDSKLAKHWGLNRNTVAAVLRRHARNARLDRSPGRGTSIPSPAPTPRVDLPRTAAQRLADLLYRSMCDGSLQRGHPLPQVKYLCRQYGVAQRTVSRAYGLLRTRGLIHRVGKSHWFGTDRSRSPGPRRGEVCLFLCEDPDAARVFTTDPLSRAYQQFEQELRGHGYVLRFSPLADSGSLLGTWKRRGRLPDGVVFHNVPPGPPLEESLSVLDRIRMSGMRPLPRVLCDWMGGAQYGRIRRGTQVLSRGNLNTAMARTIARFLVERGHREAVLCFDERAYRWPGMWSFWSYQKILSEGLAIAPGFRLRQVIVPREPGEDASVFMARMCEGRPEVLEYLADKYPALTPHKRYLDDICTTSDLFATAAGFADARIWLCSKDSLGADALEWARLSGKEVPRDLEILGFENDPRYYHLGLSVCCHDWARVGYVMAHVLIGDIPARRTTRGFLRMESPIIEKQTTR